MVEKSGRKEHERYQGIFRNLSQRTHDADDVNVKKNGGQIYINRHLALRRPYDKGIGNAY